MEWMGGTYENRDVINRFNLAVVNTIRASAEITIKIHTGSDQCGNRPGCCIKRPCHSEQWQQSNSIHTCLFTVFLCYGCQRNFILGKWLWQGFFYKWTWCYLQQICEKRKGCNYRRIRNHWQEQPVSRVAHAEHYAREAVSRGIAVFWWDNGYYNPGDAETYALLNRRILHGIILKLSRLLWEVPVLILWFHRLLHLQYADTLAHGDSKYFVRWCKRGRKGKFHRLCNTAKIYFCAV